MPFRKQARCVNLFLGAQAAKGIVTRTNDFLHAVGPSPRARGAHTHTHTQPTSYAWTAALIHAPPVALECPWGLIGNCVGRF
jgi:hypothetical protein